jgi:3-oxoacyl-[acyl-carrier protein] reductase
VSAAGDPISGVLARRVVIITGAGAGVGRGIALACARAGAHVVIAVRHVEIGEAVAQEIAARGGSALVHVCDVTSQREVEATVAAALARFGHLDAVVHNATSNRSPEPGKIEELSASLWEEHSSVSLRGSYYCARAAFEALRVRGGRFVLLTSPAGIEGSASLPFYSAVKAGQRGFVKSLAREWGEYGITVNAVSPLAASPAMVRAFEARPELEARLAALSPLGRIGDPESDIGDATALLLSDATRFITGQTWVIDGGRFLGL